MRCFPLPGAFSKGKWGESLMAIEASLGTAWILRVSYTTDGVMGAKQRNSWKEVQHDEKAVFQAGKKKIPKICKPGWKGAFTPG